MSKQQEKAQIKTQELSPKEATALVVFYREAMLKCKDDKEFLKIQQTIGDVLSKGGNLKQALAQLQNGGQAQPNESYDLLVDLDDLREAYGEERIRTQNGEEVVEEGLMDDMTFGAKAAWNGVKGLFGKGKDPTEVFYDRAEHYKRKLARIIGEMHMDLKDLGWDPQKYPQIAQAIKDLGANANMVHEMGEEGVVTKWDKIRHKIGNVVESVIVNGAVIMALNAVIPGLGSPYIHKGMVGAATAFVRDMMKGRSIKNKQDRAIMLRNALIGFGIGMTVQLASEMLNPQVTTQQIDGVWEQRSVGFNGAGTDATGQFGVHGQVTSYGNFGTRVRSLFDNTLPDEGFAGKVDINAAHKGFTDMMGKIIGRSEAEKDVFGAMDAAIKSLRAKGLPDDAIKNIVGDGMKQIQNSHWGPYLGQWLPKWSLFK